MLLPLVSYPAPCDYVNYDGCAHGGRNGVERYHAVLAGQGADDVA